MDALRQDVRYGLRMCRAHPLFTGTVVLILGLGIGANTAIFSVVDAVLLDPMPFAAAGRLVVLRGTGEAPSALTAAEFEVVRQGSTLLESVAARVPETVTLFDGVEAERVAAERVTGSYFEALGVRPLVGEFFKPQDEAPGAAGVAVLGESLWRRRFAGALDAVGRTVSLAGRNFTVIGVAPAGFGGMSATAEIWLPFSVAAATRAGTGGPENTAQPGLSVLARLRERATWEAARQQLESVAASPQWASATSGGAVEMIALREALVGELQVALMVLLSAVGGVLLIACANVTNLLLARSAARSREVSLRFALGAMRWRVARQLVTESLVLAVLGGVAGLLVAVWAIDGLQLLVPAELLPGSVRFHLDARVYAFTAVATLSSGLLFGALPALRASTREPAARLSGGGRSAGPGHDSSWRPSLQSAVVVLQVAVTTVLLVCAGLMSTSLRSQLSVDLGFDDHGMIGHRVAVSPESYHPSDVAGLAARLRDRVADLPGVVAAVVGSDAPFRGGARVVAVWPEDGVSDPPAASPAYLHSIGPGYLKGLGVPLEDGRHLDRADTAGSQPVAVISAATAARLWPAGDPVGRRLRIGRQRGGRLATVVGVVGNARFRTITDSIGGPTAAMDIYLPFAQAPTLSFELLVRAERALDPGAVRRVLRRLDPALPLSEVASLRQAVASRTSLARLQSSLLTAFAVTALVLGAVGLYGLLAYVVTRRRREIGIRLALGANRRDIVWAVVGRGLALSLVGLLLGLMLSQFAAAMMASLLFDIDASDAAARVVASAVLLGAALLASWLPARRASSVAPAITLRAD